MEPLFLKPIFHEKIWGGNKLNTIFNYDIPSDKTGECWAISAHPNGISTVINGKYKGYQLDKLWKEHPELFGYPKEEKFPLLTKIIDAKDKLSVQVHPNDEYSIKNESESGKTECWYIVDCELGAEIVYGHNGTNQKDFDTLIEKKEWESLLRNIKVAKGDFFYVPSGTIHAIGNGVVILETQQSSDTTYRLYDYDRRDELGKLRELHIQNSKEVTTIPHQDLKINFTRENQGNSVITTFLETPFFNVYKWDVKGEMLLKQQLPYLLVSVICGKGKLIIENFKEYEISKGDHFIIPNSIKNWKFQGEIEMIASGHEE